MGGNFYLFLFLKSQTENNIALTPVDKKKERKRNFVSAKSGIICGFVSPWYNSSFAHGRQFSPLVISTTRRDLPPNWIIENSWQLCWSIKRPDVPADRQFTTVTQSYHCTMGLWGPEPVFFAFPSFTLLLYLLYFVGIKIFYFCFSFRKFSLCWFSSVDKRICASNI